MIEDELVDGIGSFRSSPLRSHVSSSLDGQEGESLVLGLEADDLLVELPWGLVELSLESETSRELLSHHEVAGHVNISVVQQNSDLGIDDLLDERSHVGVLLAVVLRDLVAADIPTREIIWDVKGFADCWGIHVAHNISVIEARNGSTVSGKLLSEWVTRLVESAKKNVGDETSSV